MGVEEERGGSVVYSEYWSIRLESVVDAMADVDCGLSDGSVLPIAAVEITEGEITISIG